MNTARTIRRLDRTIQQQATAIRLLAASVAALKRTAERTDPQPPESIAGVTSAPHRIHFERDAR